MADNQKPFDLEKLKSDPGLWKRLATPFEGSDKMGNVFLEKENPFIAAAAAEAMEKVRKLAEEGKLYVREFGRSRHFQKVEKDGESFKLGEQVDAKTAGPYDPALGMLHRLSQRYFRRFGMEKIANWFGKRVEKYDAYRELDKQYKSEYDSMSKEQKEQLKALRKREKEEKSLQEKEKNLKEELEKVQKKLNDLQKDKLPQPQPPQPEQEQPQQEQEQPQQEQPQQEQNQRENVPQPGQELQQDLQQQVPGGPVNQEPGQPGQNGQGQQDPQQQVPGGPVNQNPGQPDPNAQGQQDPQQQIPGGPADQDPGQNDQNPEQHQGGPVARDNEQIIRDGDAIYIGGIKITGDVKDLDPELLRELVAQIKAQTQEQLRQEEPDIQEQPLNWEAQNNAARNPGENNPENMATQQDVSGFWAFDEGPQREDNSELILDDESVLEDHIDLIQFDDEPQQQAGDHIDLIQFDDEPQQQAGDHIDLIQFDDEPQQQAGDHIDLIQFDDEPEQPVPATLQARLAQERERLDNVTAWSNGLIEAMMNNETNREYYEGMTDPMNFNAAESSMLLVGTVSALFGTKEGRQSGQQLLESVVDGTPPKGGPAFESQVQQGIQSFERALSSLVNGDNKPMSKLVSDSIRELSRSAAERTDLSERNVLIGRLISETFRMLQENPDIILDLNEEELAAAKGALTMSVVAEKNLRARQFLGGKNDLNIRDPQTVTAVRDILMAKGVESCMRSDPPENGRVSNTQLLMGTDVLSLSKLELMTNSSQPRQKITIEQIEELMNNPQGVRAMKAGLHVAKKFARDAIQNANRELNPLENELQMQAQNPIIN